VKRLISSEEISKRMQEYLEAIYMLYIKKRIVRLKDLSKELNVKPSSIVTELERLHEEGYIDYKKREHIKLTNKGFKIAKEIYKRHVIIKRFLETLLDMPEDIADRDACYIEHGLDPETLNKIVQFMEFIEGCPKKFPNWLEHLKYYYKTGEYPEECEGINSNNKG
jgi:DtxR family Mn-dependent transcriptional regulator